MEKYSEGVVGEPKKRRHKSRAMTLSEREAKKRLGPTVYAILDAVSRGKRVNHFPSKGRRYD